jgi:hypothetical protein
MNDTRVMSPTEDDEIGQFVQATVLDAIHVVNLEFSAATLPLALSP